MTSMLICINQTIYCLLIQPNPDSALNATAGHLLQDDYDSFARQARLMTSIHASIPTDLQDAALAAKRRGEPADTGEEAPRRTTTASKSASSASSLVGRRPPECTTSTQSAPSNLHQALEGESSASEGEDEETASKENDPISLSPVPGTRPRRPSLAKRPLSDLPIVDPEYDAIDAPCLSPSEQNVVNNGSPLAGVAAPNSSRKGLQLAERSQSVNMTSRGLYEMGANSVGSVDSEERPTKRVCSDLGKENALETWGAKKPSEKALPAVSAATKVGLPASRKASTSSSSSTSGVKGKSRVGLRRL